VFVFIFALLERLLKTVPNGVKIFADNIAFIHLSASASTDLWRYINILLLLLLLFVFKRVIGLKTVECVVEYFQMRLFPLIEKAR